MASTVDAVEEFDESVVRTDIGASLEATLKRGEEPRDEDRFKIKAKGETAEDAIDEFETLLEKYEEEFSGRLRDIDPERTGDEEE